MVMIHPLSIVIVGIITIAVGAVWLGHSYGLFALGVIGGFIVGLGSNLECKYVFRLTRFKYNA